MKKLILLSFFLLVVSFVNAQAGSQVQSDSPDVILLPKLEELVNSTKINNNIKSELLVKIIKYAQQELDKLQGKRTEITASVNCQKLTQTLWEGKTDKDTGGQVTILQNFLNKIAPIVGPTMVGTDPNGNAVSVDGNYYKDTYYAVRAFQSYYKISPTGSVGPITLAKINSLICTK